MFEENAWTENVNETKTWIRFNELEIIYFGIFGEERFAL